MTVTAVGFSGPTFIQTPGNGAATVYTFPFLVSAAGDVIVGFIVGGAYTQQAPVTFTVAGIGNSGGGTVTFAIAPPFGTTVDIRSQIPETQPTNFANLGGYFPENTTNAVDRVTRLVTDMYRFAYLFSIHGPDTENTPWTQLPGPSGRANMGLLFDGNGLPTVGTLLSSPLTQSVFNSFLLSSPGTPIPVTVAELATGLVISTNFQYGDFRRYGIVPNSIAAATSNGTFLSSLLSPSINGPAGTLFSPNTTGADTYYFAFTNNCAQIRSGVTLDLNQTTWNFSGAFGAGFSNLGFLMANANVTIQNGKIVANATGSTAASVIQLGWRDGNILIPNLYDSVFLAANGYTLGNITLKNLNISFNASGGTAAAGIQALGGLQDVVIDNVWIDGASNVNSVNGLYYEFGWATNEVSRYQRQTSHAHNWRVSNYKVTNLAPGGVSTAFGSNGAYNLTFDNIYGSNLGQVLAFGTGESLFLKPWIGQDDIGSLTQMPQNGTNLTGTSSAGRNITMRNVVGRLINGDAINCNGSQHPSGWIGSSSTVQGWTPGHTYIANELVYNGTYQYKLTTLGTGISESVSPYHGPTGNTTSTDANGLVWTYQALAYGTGYRGWNLFQYAIGDVVVNGQYVYVCTTPNSSTTGPAQGPLGIGTGISDGLGGLWSSIPASGSATSFPPTGVSNSWVACSNQLHCSIDGFDIDGNGVGSGIFLSNNAVVRNGKITNSDRGIITTLDVVDVTIENVQILNSFDVFGMQIGTGAGTCWSPWRLTTGAIRNCQIAGTSIAGSSGGYGIEFGQVSNFLVENNRIGYEFIHDGIVETLQTNGILLANAVLGLGTVGKGLVCRNNYIVTPSGTTGTGLAYQLGSGITVGCLIDNPLGGDVSSTGPWGIRTINTGWGTPTGALLVTNFPGSAATLAQTGETLAQLLIVLKNNGVLGT